MFFDLLPKLADVDAEILRILGMRRSPDCRENLLMGDHAARVSGEKRQQLEFLWRQLQLGADARGAMAHGINFEIANAQHRGFGLSLHTMAQGRAHPRQQFPESAAMRLVASTTLPALVIS